MGWALYVKLHKLLKY